MISNDAFSGYHPIVNFFYFVLIIGFTMFVMHPLILLISFTAALLYAIYLNGKKAAFWSMAGLLPMMLFAAIINPLFNHQGMTIITYLPSGNPLTLESIVYGVVSALMLGSIVEWFSCYSMIMTSDKFIYLFGRVIPSISLLLSMILRFVPKLKTQFQAVMQAQLCLGRNMSQTSFVEKIKYVVKIFSMMITWALENTVETADSMKSRGYGLPGRTAFSIYRLTKRDKLVMLWFVIASAYLLIGCFNGEINWQYYPRLNIAWGNIYFQSLELVYLLLSFTPLCLNLLEDIRWRKQKLFNFRNLL